MQIGQKTPQNLQNLIPTNLVVNNLVLARKLES